MSSPRSPNGLMRPCVAGAAPAHQPQPGSQGGKGQAGGPAASVLSALPALSSESVQSFQAGKEKTLRRRAVLRTIRLSAASAHPPGTCQVGFPQLTDSSSGQAAPRPSQPARSPQPPSPGRGSASARCTRSGCPGRSGPWPAPASAPALATSSGLWADSKSASGENPCRAQHLRLLTQPPLWHRLYRSICRGIDAVSHPGKDFSLKLTG